MHKQNQGIGESEAQVQFIKVRNEENTTQVDLHS